VGRRITFVNEMICYSALKAGTNVYYGGAGTSIATVNGGITLPLIRKIVRNLQANHGHQITRMLSASPKYGTDAVSAGYLVFCHTDLEADIRDLAGFTPTERYGSGTPMEGEIGKVERFRFIGHPDMVSQQDAGAAVGVTGLFSTSGSNIDVYSVIVMAEDAWSQIALRGKNVLDPTHLPTGQKTKSDPHGQRGYVGSLWRKAVMLENNGWMAVLHVGAKAL
jgi:N4-gp56 family major capsid protein